jgi:hypothetical protein
MTENRFAALLEELHPKEKSRAASSTRLRSRGLTVSAPVRYRVPGMVPHIKQKTSHVGWATVATMLMSWHDRISMDARAAMSRIGQEYVDLYDANKGLPVNRKAAFLAAIGLQAEPPMSYPVEGWERLLREYGPLWVTTDEDPTDALVHGRVIVAIEGDGTPRGTTIHVLDPLKDGPSRETLESFLRKYQNVVQPVGPLMIQVVHYPADAGRATQQSYGSTTYVLAQNPAAAAPAAAGPALAGPLISGAGLGYQVVKDIVGAMGSDITYRLEHLKGKVHPFDDASYDTKGTWGEKTIRVRAGVLNTRIGDEQSAEFDVNYWFNGHSIGSITVSPAKANDAGTWELHVEQVIKPLPGAFAVNAKPVAAVRLEFVYKHTRPLEKHFYREELTLYGAGTEYRKGFWTQ